MNYFTTSSNFINNRNSEILLTKEDSHEVSYSYDFLRINNIIVVFCFLNNVQNAVIYNWLTLFFIIHVILTTNFAQFQAPEISNFRYLKSPISGT